MACRPTTRFKYDMAGRAAAHIAGFYAFCVILALSSFFWRPPYGLANWRFPRGRSAGDFAAGYGSGFPSFAVLAFDWFMPYVAGGAAPGGKGLANEDPYSTVYQW